MSDTNQPLRQHNRPSDATPGLPPTQPPLSAAEMELLARQVLALLRDEMRQDRQRWRQESSSV